MPEPFDPYLQWLGIEPHEMPVDHYRLLGIRRFEGDPGIIAAAADQRMLHVRTFQTGPRAVYSQKLLNELSAARICLLNPGAKASYDQVLEAVFFTSVAPPQFAQIAVPPIEQSGKYEVREEDDQEEYAETSGATMWVVAATAIIVLLVGAVAALFFRQQQANTSPVPRVPVPQIVETQETELEYERSRPVLIFQEADGSVNLDASFAQLHGPTLRLGIAGTVSVIDQWESMDDWVSWNFKIAKVPPQGVFQVRVTYAARVEADGGSFVMAVADQEKECDIRGKGEPVTDEYYLAVPNSGEHTLTVRAKSKPSQRLMTLKSVNLLFE